MKIVLLQDVPGQGKKGELKTVSDGYARNYLFPRALAMRATAGTIHSIEVSEKAREIKKAQDKEKAQQAAENLKTCTVKIHAKAGSSGRLFGAVTSKEIADALKEQFGLEIDRHKMSLPEHIKTYGVHTVKVKLASEVSTTIQVEVGE